MALATRQSLRFGPFRLEPAQRLLFRGDERIVLRPRVYDTLLVLVEHSGEIVSKEALLDAVWPDTVVEENNLNQTILALRRVLENGHGGGGDGDSDVSGDVRIETVPRRGYRFIASVEEELARPRPVTPHVSVVAPVVAAPPPIEAPAKAAPRRRLRPLLLSLAAAALLLLAVVLWRPGPFSRPGASGIRSIAVLPLKSVEADQPLGLGLAEAVVSRLSQDPELLVRPLSSSRQASLATPDAAVAGARLNVEGVLEGTLQRADGRIRATIQLVRVADRRVLWSGSFEEAESEAFLLEDSIADRLVRAMGMTAAPARRDTPRPLPKNRAAYEAYLRGRYFWNRRDGEGLQKAAAEFEESIRQDPSYALAYSGLADAQVLIGPGGPPDAFPKAREAAEKALALDPELAEAHASLGFVRFFADWDFAASERELRRAIQLNPGYVTAHHWYAYWLVAAGRTAGAVAEIRRAREIDPTSLVLNRDVGHILLYARRYPEAIDQLRRTLAMDASFHQTRLYLIGALTDVGRFEEAVAEVRGLPPRDDGAYRLLEASIEARAGRPEKLRMLLSELSPASLPPSVSAEGVAGLSGVVGDYDRAFEYLERAYRAHDFYLVFLNADTGFDSLRSDPRFAELVHRIGIPSS